MASNRNIDYATPQWLFDLLNGEFKFTIDGCGAQHNAKCARYWSVDDDGLRQDWIGEIVWWNPPFDDVACWARKAYNESLLGVTSVGLVPTRRQDYWFRLCTDHAQMRLIRGGLLYFEGGGEQASQLAKIDCTVFAFGPGFHGNTIGPYLVPPYQPSNRARIVVPGIRHYATALNTPEGTKVLRTYAELTPYIKAFASGAFDLLIIVGRPGTAKSTQFRSLLPTTTCWISGNISDFRAYCKLYDFRDQLAVFDDVDMRKSAKVNLLRELCNNDEMTTLTWDTDAAWLKEKNIPNHFETRTKVCLMVNDWATFNAHVEALEDRAVIVSFEPSAAEVQDQVAREGWFEDDEIYQFVGEHLHMIMRPSMRHYVKAKQHKDAGLVWREYLLNLWLEDESVIRVAKLLDDPGLTTMRSKARAYEEYGWGNRSTFFRKARALRPA